MLILSTSAKSMASAWAYEWPQATKALFEEEALFLAKRWGKESLASLQKKLHISEKLAILNKERWICFEEAPAVPALCLYDGDVFQPLKRELYGPKEWAYAQKSIRIFSGLYGILRACDAIKPYRLEMAIQDFSGKKYSDYWREKVTQSLVKERSQGELVLSVASQEYLAAVDPTLLGQGAYHVDFRQNHGGKLQSIALYGKKARGQMMNYCIQNKVETLEELCRFQEDGYSFAGESFEKGWATSHFHRK